MRFLPDRPGVQPMPLTKSRKSASSRCHAVAIPSPIPHPPSPSEHRLESCAPRASPKAAFRFSRANHSLARKTVLVNEPAASLLRRQAEQRPHGQIVPRISLETRGDDQDFVHPPSRDYSPSRQPGLRIERGELTNTSDPRLTTMIRIDPSVLSIAASQYRCHSSSHIYCSKDMNARRWSWRLATRRKLCLGVMRLS